MYIETQFSVFMINKPGVLAQLLEKFAKAKTNIIALTMMDSVEHGVLRVVGKNADGIRKVLSQLNTQFNETEVLCVTLSNSSGALADVTAKLAKAHINITYAYCTAGATGGRTTGILKVADVKKAIKTLKSPVKKTTRSKTVKRAPVARKK
ncbi:MAG: hypothetical protein KAS23_05955 [Anaerohalosphaera sp.]|nr:hypothetical protein [Anaerohalosphaera sp.]